MRFKAQRAAMLIQESTVAMHSCPWSMYQGQHTNAHSALVPEISCHQRGLGPADKESAV